jgi:hypothetical protein
VPFCQGLMMYHQIHVDILLISTIKPDPL